MNTQQPNSTEESHPDLSVRTIDSKVRPIKRMLFVIIPIIFIALGVYWLATFFSSQGAGVESLPVMEKSEPLPLSVPTENLDFGEVWEDESFVWNLPITNRGSEELKIQQFVPSCGCIAIESKSLEIPSQATRTVQVKINLSRGKWRPDEAVRLFSEKVTALVDGKPVRHESWALNGKVRKLFDVAPALVSFEEGSLVEGHSFPSKTVEVSAYTELTGLAAECRPPLGTAVVVASKNNTSNTRFSVIVTPNKATLPVGNLEFEVVLRGHTKDAVLPPVPFMVLGKVLQEVEAVPPAILFGHGILGERAEDTVVLRSRTGEAFRVLTVQSSSESIEAERLKDSPDSSPQFRIQQTFRGTGQQTAQMTFVAVIDGRRISVVVPVRYYGLTQRPGERED